MSEFPSFRPFVLPTMLLVFGGWGGVAALVFYTEPLIWMRWALFALLFLALTGTALPFVYIFHLRYPSERPIGPRVIIRQAQWVGAYGLILLWLRQGELLSLWLTLGLAGSFLAIEWLIRLRERAHWDPPITDDQPTENGDDEPA